MTNSRRKGKVGEQEFATLLKTHGFEARRGCQFKGGQGSPDVICDGLGAYHFEVKRVEAGNLFTWMKQAERDAGTNIPVVAHRRNGEQWVAVMRMEDFLLFVAAQQVKSHG